MKLKLYKIAKFLGRKGLAWLGVGMVCGIASSAIEITLSKILQLVLFTLGVTKDPIVISLGPFGKIDGALFTLVQLSTLMVVVGLVRGLTNFLINQSAAVANEVINTRLRMIAFYETMELKSGFLSLSDLNNKLGEIFPKATACCYYSALFIPNVIYCSLMIFFMATLSMSQTLLALVGIGIIGVIVYFINTRVRIVVGKLPVEHETMMKGIIRVVRNWFLIRALRTTEAEHVHLIKTTLNYSSHAIRANFLINCGSVLPPVLGVGLLTLIIGSYQNSPSTTPINFFSFLYLLMRFIQLLSNMATQWGAISSNFPHFKIAARYFFSFEPHIIANAMAPASLLSASGGNLKAIHQDLDRKVVTTRVRSSSSSFAPTLQVKEVGFSYAGHGTEVLKNVSFTGASGSQIGITGQSGSGKSTLLGIILGVLEPTKGSIEIEGKSPKSFLANAPFAIGYVGSESFLIAGSLRDNLLYGLQDSTVTDQDCIEALKTAQLGEFVSRLQNGLDYPISENGEGLSTGQKQRLSLARALLARPRLLILDEVSANLDESTELDLAETIKGLKSQCTTLIVSHRPGILKYVDQVITL